MSVEIYIDYRAAINLKEFCIYFAENDLDDQLYSDHQNENSQEYRADTRIDHG